MIDHFFGKNIRFVTLLIDQINRKTEQLYLEI